MVSARAAASSLSALSAAGGAGAVDWYELVGGAERPSRTSRDQVRAVDRLVHPPLPPHHKGGRCACARRLSLGVPGTKIDVLHRTEFASTASPLVKGGSRG